MPALLNNKVAIVTGGCRGIGRAISLALAKQSASVLVTYREKQSLAQELVRKIEQLDVKAKICELDVADRKSVKNMVDTALKEFGAVDILVNNAGINKPTDFDEITIEDWDEILDVNLKGPFICCQEILPALRKRGGGSIINIGSVSGQYGGPRTAHYAASKAALISLGQVVARFGAQDNIRCNTIAAGLIESDMANAGLANKNVSKMLDSIILKRLGTADEVAQSVVFLASDLSKYITAQTINVNGGLYF